MIRSYLSRKYKISLEEARRCEREARQSLGLKGDNSDNSSDKEFAKVQKKAEEIAAAGLTTKKQTQKQAKKQELARENTSLSLVLNENGSLSHSRYTVPHLLDCAGVPHGRWKRIHAAVSSQLSPAVVQAREIKVRAFATLQNYQHYYHNEREIMRQILVSANLSNCAVVKATNIVSLANYLLNDKGILAEIEYESSRPLQAAQQEYFRDYEFVLPVGVRLTLVGKDDDFEEPEQDVIRAY
ncbi:expressed unknown protein [Seminavis robusta]|uniref:Uncharacterized protein n=1 Tax=Seminavis robusta TaxID=568900 RepID=A0A9N8HIE8_9STRA|nr:expressed unknown protein [Seminavis robusta]|eukprot:Sro778_g201130.1 n/a (241) ;mRNA; r:18984-19706